LLNGYDGPGRDALENIYASTFKTKAVSAPTHYLRKICNCYCSFWCFTSRRRSSLEVVGVTENGIGSFKEHNIGYDFVPLSKDNTVDFNAVKEKITEKNKSYCNSTI
jgi:cystathionine beta-lyase family protein involved in aluminum resistance